MNKQKQNPVTVVILVLVIAIAFAFIIKTALPKRYPRPKVDWTCEACSHNFIAESQAKPMQCPKCGAEAVRVYYYYCSVHDHMFEAYRSKPNPDVKDVKPEEMMPMEHMMLYKTPDGDWTTEYPMKITCPDGNSDRATLEYCSPTSERRKEK